MIAGLQFAGDTTAAMATGTPNRACKDVSARGRLLLSNGAVTGTITHTLNFCWEYFGSNPSANLYRIVSVTRRNAEIRMPADIKPCEYTITITKTDWGVDVAKYISATKYQSTIHGEISVNTYLDKAPRDCKGYSRIATTLWIPTVTLILKAGGSADKIAPDTRPR